MTIKRYRPDALRKLQNKFLKEKGGEIQIGLLRNARDMGGREFVVWLENQMKECAVSDDIFLAGKEPPMPDEPERYTAGDFIKLTNSTFDFMWKSWRGFSPGYACGASAWSYIIAQLIAAERILPYYLMHGGNGGKKDGKEEIDMALSQQDKDKRKTASDRLTRTFLRRWCGVFARGARSLYTDCPPARAWWQRRIAEQVASSIERKSEEILALFQFGQVWAELAENMASRLTVIGDVKLRDGIISFFLGADERFKREALRGIFRGVGVMSAWRGLGMFSPQEIESIIASEIASKISLVSDKEESNETST